MAEKGLERGGSGGKGGRGGNFEGVGTAYAGDFELWMVVSTLAFLMKSITLRASALVAA